MALAHPDEYLSVANLTNILKQMRHVISASFLLIDGFPSSFVLMKKTYILILITSLISFFLFLQNTIILQDKQQKKLRVFILLLSFIPLISLVIFAHQDGNTFRIIPRYIAYAYAFNLILISLIIKDLWQKDNLTKYAIFFFFGIQFFMIIRLDFSIWNDTAPRYFMSFVQPRKMNPYEFSANKIQHEYAKGDTVIYPSTFIEKTGGILMPKYSVVDAQLTNFYLPKTSEIMQRVEPNEPNKIFLKKADGKELLIFDFEGAKYRY